LPWVEGILATYGVFHNVRCKVCSTINKKPCPLAPTWDTLMKHQGKKKVKKDFPELNINKRHWYNNKTCKHTKNQALFFA
jgi:hypothetical protein